MDSQSLARKRVNMPRETIYAFTTVDTSDFKRTLCGRTNDIAKLLNYIDQGVSIALFGERRIGKTSLLYMIRDIINGDIDTYRDRLLDESLISSLDIFRNKTSQRRAIFISLHELPEPTPNDLVQLLGTTLKKEKLIKNSNLASLPELLAKLGAQLQKGEKIIFLIDETETLLETEKCRQLLRNLRSAIQTYPQFCFVFAGAENWHNQFKDRTSPLVNNVRLFYLKAAERFSIEEYLVRRPLAQVITEDKVLESVVSIVGEWTAYKPWFVQSVCSSLIEVTNPNGTLPQDWKSSTLQRVKESTGPTLSAFYTGANIDPFSRKILALLANKPRLTITELSRMLDRSTKSIRDKINDLEALDKVRKEGNQYRIVGTLLESWGQQTQDIPSINRWPRYLKWGAAILLCILALFAFFYTHPKTVAFTFDFPDGTIQVQMPASLEAEETGSAVISVQNTSASDIYSMTVSLSSVTVDYEQNGTNRVTYNSISYGETKYWRPTYATRKPLTNVAFSSEVTIGYDPVGYSNTHQFDLNRRIVPIKRYWSLISLLLVAISGFLTKGDLAELVAKLLPSLLKSGNVKSEKEEKSEDR